MFKPTISRFMATIFTAVLTVAFTAQAFGQTEPYSAPAINPHDFSDKFYITNGVEFKELNDRLTGEDFLSTFTPTDNPDLSDVRVLITLPAYLRNGQPVFWSPLGRLNFNLNDPNQDYSSVRDLASRNPIYVFPVISASETSYFSGTRQAPLMVDSFDLTSEPSNPLGLRMVMTVTYTANAATDTGLKILEAMAKENGMALDGGPIVKSIDDLKTLLNHELINISGGDTVAVCPVVQNIDNGAIAKDAFLSMTTSKEGEPLDAERIFVTMFACAQDKNNCSQVQRTRR
ncbi:MAG: hypothetical protein ACKVRN_12225 [Pyrinomonadaceae bacterium]